MKQILNITNGDSTVEIMKQARIPGKYLPWRDVLHDGPVPAALSLQELSMVRAEFIAGCGWGDLESIKKSFTARDAHLLSCEKYDKIILWFEHDLYDQLQILQILDWFHLNPLNDNVELSIICTDRYLGSLSAAEMDSLFKYEMPVTKRHLTLASTSWAAFRSDSPIPLVNLLDTDISSLPFLKQAIIRLLEEYPSTYNGLSRTEQQALTIINAGENRPGRVFGQNQKQEESVFMGDSSFWIILNGFLQANPPLLKLSKGNEITIPVGPDQKLTVSTVGKDVLAGRKNWLEIISLNKWIGGVHLSPTNTWCWDTDSKSMVKLDRI